MREEEGEGEKRRVGEERESERRGEREREEEWKRGGGEWGGREGVVGMGGEEEERVYESRGWCVR